jgi:hypothetical protein
VAQFTWYAYHPKLKEFEMTWLQIVLLIYRILAMLPKSGGPFVMRILENALARKMASGGPAPANFVGTDELMDILNEEYPDATRVIASGQVIQREVVAEDLGVASTSAWPIGEFIKTLIEAVNGLDIDKLKQLIALIQEVIKIGVDLFSSDDSEPDTDLVG